ncbi:hypothetical protein WDU94_005162, partial [Cyamophila willieti]
GKGLGKKEDGIDKALKPKLKFDTAGLGHDPGEQFTNKWWESAYNSAANNIDVKNKQSEVEIKKNGDIEILTKKTMVWKKESSDQSADDSDDISSASMSMPVIVPLSDEQLFAACGGLTAHKAARHGHKLSGKLKRLQEQEATLGDSNVDSDDTPKKKKKRNDPTVIEPVMVEKDEESKHFDAAFSEKKKTKKDKHVSNTECCGGNDAINMGTGNESTSKQQGTQKKKKKNKPDASSVEIISYKIDAEKPNEPGTSKKKTNDKPAEIEKNSDDNRKVNTENPSEKETLKNKKKKK